MSVWLHTVRPHPASPPVGSALGEIHHIDASSASNVWVAVDNPPGAPSGASDTINVYQWNGTSWANHPCFLATGTHLRTTRLQVFSATDVWLGTGASIAHWTGSSWTHIWTPPDSFTHGTAFGALSDSDLLWATTDHTGTDSHVDLWRWNGAASGMNAVTLIDTYGHAPQPADSAGFPGVWRLNDGSLYVLCFSHGDSRAAELLQVTTSSAAIQRVYTFNWNMHSLWLQSQAIGWVVGDKFDFDLQVPLPVIETGMGSSWGSVTAPDYYLAQDPDHGISLFMHGIHGASSSDLVICGRLTDTDFGSVVSRPYVIDRRVGGVWTHYPFEYTQSAGDTGFHAARYFAANDIWVGGSYFNLLDNKTHTTIQHWNGSVWETTRDIPPGL